MIAYARVSTTEQARGDSCERQLAIIQEHAKLHKLAIEEVIVDDGYTGANERRPGWQRLTGLLAGGAEGVVAVDLSRLHRNAGDAIRFAETYIVQRGLRLVLLAEQIDLSTAAGKLQYTIMVGAAQFHSDSTKEKVRRAMAYKRTRGEKTGGHTPYGYTAVEGVLVPDPDEQAVVQQMVAWQSSGMGYTAIAAAATRAGWRTKMGSTRWDAKTVSRILQRRAS